LYRFSIRPPNFYPILLNIFQSLNLNPKEKEDEENSYSYMRIGDKTYYRVSAKKENKKKNKKTKTKDKGEDR